MKAFNNSVTFLVILILCLQAGLNQMGIPINTTICRGNSPKLLTR